MNCNAINAKILIILRQFQKQKNVLSLIKYTIVYYMRNKTYHFLVESVYKAIMLTITSVEKENIRINMYWNMMINKIKQ